MAERRMFANRIVMSDDFLAMPISARCLYFYIGMAAQNKGVLNNVFSTCASVGCSRVDVQCLIDHGFLKELTDGYFEIVHWYENNGIGETAKKRLSYRYRQWRKSVLERDNYTCQKCGAKEKVMEVHHIKSFAKYPELRDEVSNGITLCHNCHVSVHKEERHGRSQMD